MTVNDKHLEKHEQKGGDQPLAGAQITKSEDSALKQRQELLDGLKSHRITKDGNAFTIDMGDGHTVQDVRAAKVSPPSIEQQASSRPGEQSSAFVDRSDAFPVPVATIGPGGMAPGFVDRSDTFPIPVPTTGPGGMTPGFVDRSDVFPVPANADDHIGPAGRVPRLPDATQAHIMQGEGDYMSHPEFHPAPTNGDSQPPETGDWSPIPVSELAKFTIKTDTAFDKNGHIVTTETRADGSTFATTQAIGADSKLHIVSTELKDAAGSTTIEKFDLTTGKKTEDIKDTGSYRFDTKYDSNSSRELHQLKGIDKVETRDMPGESEAKLHAIEKKYGVHVEIKNGQAEYHLRAGGKDNTLFTLPEGDTKRAESILDAEVRNLESALGVRYGARFSTTDSAVETVDASGKLTGNHATCRPPRLDELVGIQAALGHSEPSTRSITGEGIRFYFLREGQHYVENHEGGANYVAGNPPKVCIDFNEQANAPTEIDRKTMGTHRSMEYDITHELAHNTQYRLDWRIDEKDPPDTRVEDSFARQMGWKKIDGQYYLQGKDHLLYKSDPTNPDRWIAYKEDSGGRVHADHQTNSQSVKAVAEVPPLTNYFTNPKEEMAECLTLYRLGPAYQRILAQNSKLYELTAQLDQWDINKSYVEKNNRPTHIRRSDGLLEEVQQL